MIALFAILCFSLGVLAVVAHRAYGKPLKGDLAMKVQIELLEQILVELQRLHRKVDHMAGELANLQTAAAAAIALLQKLNAALTAAGGGVPAAEVQAVADQLTAAVTANTPAST